MSDLDKLIEAAEGGVELDVLDEWGYWLNAFPMNESEKAAGDFESDNACNGRLAWSGSLDAAKALHDALLPGFKWDIQGHTGHASVWGADVDGAHTDPANPARAWLLAILKAYRAQVQQ